MWAFFSGCPGLYPPSFLLINICRTMCELRSNFHVANDSSYFQRVWQKRQKVIVMRTRVVPTRFDLNSLERPWRKCSHHYLLGLILVKEELCKSVYSLFVFNVADETEAFCDNQTKCKANQNTKALQGRKKYSDLVLR